MPPLLRHRVYGRLREVLIERDPVAMEIVRDTKTDLPEGW